MAPEPTPTPAPEPTPATRRRTLPRARPLSARGRLTLLLTALVLAAGLALTALTHLLLRRGLDIRLLTVQHRYDHSPPVTAPDAATPTEVTVDSADLPEELREAMLAELLGQAPIALAAVTLLTAALGWLVAGRVLRPIRTITATARHLSAERLTDRVPVPAPADELAALATTVNDMLDRVHAGVAERDRVLDSQRMFTANAAHELRTPLATIRTAVDVTLEAEPDRGELLTMAADVRAAATHSQHLLDGLLALAHSQAGLRERRPTDLAHLAAALLDGAAERASTGGLTLRPELRPARVAGDPVLLERMVGNLLDNALRYNHPSGLVTLATGTDAAGVFLRVANTGRSLSPETAAGLLDPFVRGEAGGGAGLGLSIVRAIAGAHHGSVTATPRPAGGLAVTVRLPGSGEGGDA